MVEQNNLINPNNLVFLDRNDLDKPINRIFSFKRVREIFETNNLTLVKPKEWDDPFENFILNSSGYLPDGRKFEIRFRDSFYGQCWSRTKESDAMWRIYSPEKNGVKVKTTIGRLITALLQSENIKQGNASSFHRISAFIGKVKYQGLEKLLGMLKDKERMSDKIYDETGWGQASSFYFKRWAFRHENEVRIMYNNHGIHDNNLFKFHFDPLEVIDQIVFDPRMKWEEYQRRKDELRSFGFEKDIIRSGLYKIRKFRIELSEFDR